MVIVRETIIAITTQNLNSNPMTQNPQIKQLTTAHARSIDRKKITRPIVAAILISNMAPKWL